MSKSPSLRRIQADVRELALDPSDRYHAAPLENDMFEWHFTIRGAAGTDFEDGVYHGRILLPPEYPFKPPHIVMLTPSGRFETNTKICLSFSAFHPELWQPAWGIRLILEALISFLPTPADGAIGALDWSPTERKRLALQSIHFECPICGKVADVLPKLVTTSATTSNNCAATKPSRFQKEIEQLHQFQLLQHGKKEENQNDNVDVTNSTEMTPSEQASLKPEDNESEQTISDKEKTPVVRTENSAESNVASSSAVVAAAAEESGLVMTNEPTVTAPAVATTETNADTFHHQVQSRSVLDPILQTIIVILSVICYLLFRKMQALVADIQALEE